MGRLRAVYQQACSLSVFSQLAQLHWPRRASRQHYLCEREYQHMETGSPCTMDSFCGWMPIILIIIIEREGGGRPLIQMTQNTLELTSFFSQLAINILIEKPWTPDMRVLEDCWTRFEKLRKIDFSPASGTLSSFDISCIWSLTRVG